MSIAGVLVVVGMISSAALHAAEPTVASDGSVCLRVVLPATEAEVRRQLDTAAEVAALNGEARLISAEPAGSCERLTYKTRGLVSSLTYVSLRCPTATGWTETLESSDTFVDNRAEWRLREVEGGTEVDYRVRVRLNLPVGQSLVDSQIAQTLKRTIEQLEERLSGP